MIKFLSKNKKSTDVYDNILICANNLNVKVGMLCDAYLSL